MGVSIIGGGRGVDLGLSPADAHPVFDDHRGQLLPVELDDVDFVVRRVFVVTGAAGGSTRGDHVVPCAEEAVLLSGVVRFHHGESEVVLDRPGQRFRLTAGEHVLYHLADEHTRILVLAEQPYRP